MGDGLKKYIIKNSEKNNRRLKYDFMPSLLEIIERPSHVAGTVTVVAIAVLFVCAVVWACVSELEVVVNGTGNIVPGGKLIELQPLRSGGAEALNVKIGDYVNRGDVLLTVENPAAEPDREQLKYNMEWCEIRTEIARGRLFDDAYRIAVEAYDDRFKNGLNQLVLEIDMYHDQKDTRKKDLEEAIAELEEARTEDNNEYMIPTLEERVVSYKESMVSAAKSHRSQMYSQIFSLEQEMRGYTEESEKLDIEDEAFDVVAPVSGYVNMVSIESPGQAVTAGSPVITIVPSDKELTFECYVPDKDRAEIDEGMAVNLKIAAYSFSDYGAVTGEITYISPSVFSHEDYGNVYVVRIDIDEESMNPAIDLRSGLYGNVEIITGRRTIIRYFLEPITKGLGESLKEN